jgi:hypothetical protein
MLVIRGRWHKNSASTYLTVTFRAGNDYEVGRGRQSVLDGVTVRGPQA